MKTYSALIASLMMATTTVAAPTTVQSCSPSNPLTTPCPLGSKCQAFLLRGANNNAGGGKCVPIHCDPTAAAATGPCPNGTRCQKFLGSTNVNAQCVPVSSVCWESMGQYGCKANPDKSGTEADGCYATESKCTDAATAPPSVCWESMGQYGCKVNPDNSGSIADGCFPSKHVCEHGLQR